MFKNGDTIFQRSGWIMAILFASFFLVIFGVKLSFIGNYANQTPYWDQWDAEAANLYIPYLEKHLELKSLIAPHNEHRILTTRISALILTNINGVWNPLLEMVVNAALASATICLLNIIIADIVGFKYLPVLILFSLGLFVIPYGWENVLCGFQTQFYLVILLGAVALNLMAQEAKMTRRWWLGIMLGIITFFSMASGAFVFAAAAITSGIRNIKHKSLITQKMSFLVLASLFLLSIYLTPSVPHHESLKAHSISGFITALDSVVGWPTSAILPKKYGFLACLFQVIPSLCFLFWMLGNHRDKKSSHWVLFALVIWIMISEASISYGRAVLPIASRYTDVYAWGVVFSFACLIFFLEKYRRNGLMLSLAGAWTLLTFISILHVAHRTISIELPEKKASGIAEEMNVRNYVLTGDMACLLNKKQLDIPYPNPQRLADLLDIPSLRTILPPNISDTGKSGRFDFLVNLMISRALSFVVLGFCGFILVYLLAAQDITLKRSEEFTHDVS